MAFHCFVVPKALATQAIHHVSHGAGIVHRAAARALVRPAAAPAAAADTCSAPVNALRAMRALAGLPAAALVAGGMGLGAAAATLATAGAPAAYRPGGSFAATRPQAPYSTAEIGIAAASAPTGGTDAAPSQVTDLLTSPAPDGPTDYQAKGPATVQRLAHIPTSPIGAPMTPIAMSGPDSPVEAPRITRAEAARPTDVPEPAFTGLFVLPAAIVVSVWLTRHDRKRASA